MTLAAGYFALCGNCFSSELSRTKLEKLDGGYVIAVPMQVRVEQVGDVEDFSLYRLTDTQGKVLLTIYLGNAPQPVEDVGSEAIRTDVKIGRFTATSIKWTNETGLHNEDIRIRLLERKGGWPSMAHIAYRDLPKDDEVMVREVIRSFSRAETARVR